MNIKPMHKNFKVPTKSTAGAGAFDLYMPESGHIEEFADSPVRVKLGFSAEVPENHVAFLLPRSGVGSNKGLELHNTCGVIDSDYRGEWLATLNTKLGLPHEWQAGDRLLQVLIVPVADVTFNVVDELGDTERGEGGLGSTGL
ncbi:dUTP diphosphatase [Vreelandella venusta]|uniref:dUTP diphosphatase n=1 Tax=Vreelandella venusta TaxID=44935 RepID=UPI001166FB72|nr:dUTP diphosphatase [Halomonas venusta]GEK52356.1 deoxyuridine 5'-triphosphate nucleotidohydrolase [Halomonas venusta]